MLKLLKKTREKTHQTNKSRDEFLKRIKKTLYYGELPTTDRLSLPMTELATELFSESKRGQSLDRLFHYDAAKITRSACVSPCSFVLAMLYLERLKTTNKEYLTRVAPSELFLVSLMVASKFLQDDSEEEVFIDEWASSAGISLKELIHLESDFLKAIEWELFVQESTFWKKLGELEITLARRMGTPRGWFTYTELNTLLLVDLNDLIQSFAAIFTMLATSYLLGVLTVIGSIFIVSSVSNSTLQLKSILPDTNTPVEHKQMNLLASNIPVIYTEIGSQLGSEMRVQSNIKCLDAADVLKASILLASIQHPNNYSKLAFETPVNNSEEIQSWAWWTNPAMDWLTKTSKMVEICDFVPLFKQFIYTHYADIIINTKVLDLEAQIDKSTKLRIQEQMERTWHMEWTDTIISTLLMYKLLLYCFFRS